MNSRVYIVYDETSEGGGICEGQENDSWPSRETRYISVSFRSLHRNPPTNRFFYHSEEVPSELLNENHLHLAVVRYSDGDTFGSSSGHWYIVGLYKTRQEAKTEIEQIKKETGYSIPWNGYFNSYEDDEIHELELRD